MCFDFKQVLIKTSDELHQSLKSEHVYKIGLLLTQLLEKSCRANNVELQTEQNSVNLEH